MAKPLHDMNFIFWSRLNVVLFLAAFFISSAIVLGNTALLFAGVMWAGILLSAWWLSREAARGLEVRREHTERIFELEKLTIRYIFNKNGMIPAFLVECRDTIPIGDNMMYRVLLSERVGRREHVVLDSRVECVRTRGAFRLGPIEMLTGDPAGIISSSASEMSALDSEILVCPRGRNIENLSLLDQGLLYSVGLETRQRAGDSGEFFGLREYRPGDPPRHIHWRSSMRHARFLVREFVKDVTTDLAIFVDVRRLSRTGTGEHSSIEYALKCTAHLACTAQARAHRFSAWFIGSDPEHFPTGGGMMHLLHLLDRMVTVKAHRDLSIESRLTELSPSVRRGGTAVLILSSTNLEFDSLRPVLSAWGERHVKIVVVLIDDRSFLKVFKEQRAIFDSAPPLRQVTSCFIMTGCHVYTLSQKDDLMARLSRVEKFERSA